MKIYQVTLYVIFILSTFFDYTEEICKDDNVFAEMTIYGMWSADCYDRNFKKFPQCIKSHVEIIDLTYNRLRNLSRDDLKQYTNLKILYLTDNLLTNIDNDAFLDMDKLISLDLSLNTITKLPSSIFQLPALKKLYLSQNKNMNIIEVVDKIDTITSPLEYLDIGFNELEALPKFGIIPNIRIYNISGNKLTNMEPEDVAGMCNLKILVNDNNFTAYFNDLCHCWNIQKWLNERKVIFTRMPCEILEKECVDVSEKDTQLYENCREMERKPAFLNIEIPVFVVLAILVIVIIYFIYRRRKRQKVQSSGCLKKVYLRKKTSICCDQIEI